MLPPGTRLGVYEVVAQIGAGGMGEVYRARDTRLDRTVAIKVISAELTTSDLRERFEREARTVASLNHPHICTLYDIGHHNGTDFLVLEFLEGETLEARLRHGALPLDRALQIAVQVADALAAAHRAGIVHRDVKPGNVMLTKSGAKLLDFGLAKASAPAFAGTGSMLPTTPPALTVEGSILGTFQYMAPEQLEGQEADARTDIFAFGAVLYEAVTGRKAFDGKSQASVIAAIIERDPAPVSALQPLAPRSLDRLIRKCLAKDPDARWQTARDLLDELKWIADAGDVAAPNMAVTTAMPRRRRITTLMLPTVTALAVIATTVAAWLALTRGPESRPVSRWTISPPGAAMLNLDGVLPDLAMTPDGSKIVYVGNGGNELFVRAIGSLQPQSIFKGAARGPFISPDGQWVGFQDTSLALKQVPITGGPVATIGPIASAVRGATWLADDAIVFATSSATVGLRRISRGAATIDVLTRPDATNGELYHFFPEAIPDRQAVLFTIMPKNGGLDAAQIAVLDLATGNRTVLVRGGYHAHYAASGHLLYGAGGGLWAIAFDVDRLAVRGTPVPVLPQVATTGMGAVDAVLSPRNGGTLAYLTGGISSTQRTIAWVDRQGREDSLQLPPSAYLYPRIAPDSGRVALYRNDQEQDIWVWDAVGLALTRLTFDPGLDTRPAWDPGGRRIFFSSERGGGRNIFSQAADGTGVPQRLTNSPNTQDVSAVTADGQQLIFSETTMATNTDIMQLPLNGDGQAVALVRTSFSEQNGIVSPDGRWLAYEANDSGQFEVYVRPYPDVNSGHWQVSTGGGTRPIWAPVGRELFYVSPDGAIMGVTRQADAPWVATAPAKIINAGYLTVSGANSGRTYDISPDGRRFLMIKSPGANQSPEIIVVQSWFDELRRLVPGN